MPRPSPRRVPSDFSENGRHSPDFDKAGVFEKHMYMKMSFIVSAPPQITRSDWPSHSSLTPIEMAENELAQAASVTQLVPPRSRRLAMRPATTFPRRPGNVDSCHGTYASLIRFVIASTSSSAYPRPRSEFFQTGCWRRLTMVPSSSWELVTPRMQLIRSLSTFGQRPRVASSRTCLATTSARSCVVSVAGTIDGGTPHSSGSKGTGSRNAPR